MSLDGIKLAISDTGGARGTRRLPLIAGPESWQLFVTRCERLAESGSANEVEDLLNVLVMAAKTDEGEEREFGTVISACLAKARVRWSGTVLTAAQLGAYCTASERAKDLEPLPDLERTWAERVGVPAEAVSDYENGFGASAHSVEEWAKLVDVIRENEPRFFRRPAAAEAYMRAKGNAIRLGKMLLTSSGDPESAEQALGEAYLHTACAAAIRATDGLGAQEENLEELANILHGESARLEGVATEMDDSGAEQEEPWPTAARDDFDVDGLFADF